MTTKYLATITLMAFGLMTGLAQPSNNPEATGKVASQPPSGINGRTLFLHNCAHCHGADAHGDDGPDLHDLALADNWIANRIRKGKSGQMTSFAGKLKPAEIAALVAYVQSLK
jgi:mono/diheme cytochrome c family protein